MKIYRKILSIIILMLFVFIISGCNNKGPEYKITYYVDNMQVVLEPSTYYYGDDFSLPLPSVKEGKVFNGWYLYEDLFGTKVVSVKDRMGNLLLYGSIVDAESNNNQNNNNNDNNQNNNNNDDNQNNNNDNNQNYFKVDLTKSPMIEVADKMCYDSYTGETYGVTIGLPSIGAPKVLVIPIAFSDYPAPKNMKQTLETAFFGTSEDTGWESLQSYYYKSSYGQLNIGGTVLSPFNTGKSISYYNSLQKQYIRDLEAYQNYETDVIPDGVEYEILKAALEYYDSEINYADYDYNKDGLIDSIYLVYSCNYSDDYESLWWAFTQEYLTENYEYYDEVEADFYCFFSYQFFFDKLYGKEVKLNCETVIHETGHLLGLDDYYDYSEYEGPSGGIGGGDMMDYNVGDHNAYSKMMLGWIDPLVVTGTSTITLSSFGKTGESVFIFKDYNNTFFDEYFVIDYYTPDGLNDFGKGENGLFDTNGIRIYHVNATLNNPSDCYSIFELTLYNNSYSDIKLISLVEADGRNDILDNGYSEDSDLYKSGDVCNNLKWYDNSKTNFTITVNSINSSSATITIEFNN